MVKTAAAAVEAETCHLALYDAETDELISRRPSYTAAGEPVPQFRFPLSSSPASALVVRTGTAHISNDPGNDPLYDPSVRERGVRSVMTVPIRLDDRIAGLVYALNRPGGFTPEDARTLGALATSMAVTLENIRLYAEERDRRVLNESLCEVSRALVVGVPSEETALGVVLDQLWRVVRYRAAAAVIVEDSRLRVAASRGGDIPVEIPLAQAGGLRRVLDTRKVALLPDSVEVLTRLGIRGAAGKAVAAPLVANGQVLGALVAAFDAEQTSEAREGTLVGSFADHTAVFLDTSRLLRRERQARARAATVARVARMVATRVDTDSILKFAASEILALSGADRSILYLGHARNPVLIPAADAGTAPGEQERVRELRLDLTSAALAPLAEDRVPLLFHGDAKAPPGEIVVFADTRALLLIPLVSRDVIMGAIALAWVGRHHTTDPVHMEFLHDVAQQVALSLENARLFAAMSRMAATDELTRLANRRRFMEAFQLELARARRNGAPVSVIMLDVDHLKKVNDTFGHPAGDAAIRHVADVLRSGRRETDVPARLGGEEFALLLPATDLEGAVKAAEIVHRELNGSNVPNVGTVTASIGVATFPEDGVEAKDLLKTADERLYSAKAAGRNQVCYLSLPTTIPPAGANAAPKPEA